MIERMTIAATTPRLTQSGNWTTCGTSVRRKAPDSKKKRVSEGRAGGGVRGGRESNADQIAMAASLEELAAKVDEGNVPPATCAFVEPSYF